MDGIHVSSTPSEGGEGTPPGRVMVLAATNFPWDIDDAMRCVGGRAHGCGAGQGLDGPCPAQAGQAGQLRQ